MTKMDPVVHFEMPYKDAKRVAEFYNTAFGWEMKQFGKEMGDYITADTGPSDVKGPTDKGYINGGFFPHSDDAGRNMPSFVVNVANLEEAMKKVTAAGGKIVGEPQNIPGVGMWVVFIDSEGNRCSLMQASMT
jgi:predicted enzyme related to lactoylglutathione lyase